MKSILIYRSIRTENSDIERIGIGMMYKKGREIDELELAPPYFALVYVVSGRGEYIDYQGRKHPINSGMVFLRHPEIRHSTILDPKSNWREYFVEVGKPMYNMLIYYGILKKEEFVFSITNGHSLEIKFRNLIDVFKDIPDDEIAFFSVRIIELITDIMKLHREIKKSSISHIIEDAAKYFSNQISKRINIRQYCKTKGVGYENFRKLFKQQIGIPPAKYIVSRRIDTACQLLKVSGKTISEIAFELGYKSPYEFSAQFKKYTGFPPVYYRPSGGIGYKKNNIGFFFEKH